MIDLRDIPEGFLVEFLNKELHLRGANTHVNQSVEGWLKALQQQGHAEIPFDCLVAVCRFSNWLALRKEE